jgi:hypothetical protein
VKQPPHRSVAIEQGAQKIDTSGDPLSRLNETQAVRLLMMADGLNEEGVRASPVRAKAGPTSTEAAGLGHNRSRDIQGAIRAGSYCVC